MRADVEAIIQRCSLCTRAKATLNRTHGQFRVNQPHPIRTRWSIDFANHGQGYILTCIDIDANHVEYIFTTDRSASTVTREIEHIFLRHSIPDIVSFDDAPEFTGTLFSAFLERHGIKPISSGGYHPTANARIERNHRFLNESLRTVSDAEYHPDRIQATLMQLARTWNNHTSKSTGTSAAKLYRGVPIRSSLHAITRAEASTAPLSDTAAAQVADAVSVTTKAQEALAKVNRIFQQKKAMAQLNGLHQPTSFAVDDVVIAYQPLASIHSQRAQKHQIKFSHPCRVTERLSASMYKLKDVYTKKSFQRHISTLRRHTRDPLTTRYSPSIAHIRIGETVATIDASGPFSTGILIGTITQISDSDFTVHHFGSRSLDLRRAVFRLAYTDTRGRVSFAGTRSFNPQTDTPWTTTFDLNLDCLVAMNLDFRDSFHLTNNATTYLTTILAQRSLSLLSP